MNTIYVGVVHLRSFGSDVFTVRKAKTEGEKVKAWLDRTDILYTEYNFIFLFCPKDRSVFILHPLKKGVAEVITTRDKSPTNPMLGEGELEQR
jgi:hypothetical protein